MSGIDGLAGEVYAELRSLAAVYMARERGNHTLQPTALVNEVYLRMADDARLGSLEQGAFIGIAARVMRRVLVDHARKVQADKRGGGRARVTLHDSSQEAGGAELDILDLHEALEELGAEDPRRAEVVELRFFAGLTSVETAELLGRSKTVVDDDWYLARAWLRRRLEVGPDDARPAPDSSPST